MNTISSSYNRNQSFGMAFEKPSANVMKYYHAAVSELPINERASFVEEIGKIVKKNAEVPVPVKQEVDGALFTATAGSRCYYSNNSKNKAEAILTAINAATQESENIANVNANMNKINQIFDIKA